MNTTVPMLAIAGVLLAGPHASGLPLHVPQPREEARAA